MKTQDLAQCIDRLTDDQPPRVWSLIVTIFGDMAVDRGQPVSGAVLAEILSPIGIKPEAMRVALHRLRNEDWLEAERQGRQALHRLTEQGRAQSLAAQPRIYDAPQPTSGNWRLAVLAQATSEGVGLRVTPQVALVESGNDDLPQGALVLDLPSGPLPSWIGLALVPQETYAAAQDLRVALNSLPDLSGATPLTCAILRTLIVHRWRRIALRLPDLPSAQLGPDWPIALCREAVLARLAELPKPDLSTLA